MGREKPKITDEAIELLKEYEWRGNIRELKNIVQRFFLMNMLQSIKTSSAALLVIIYPQIRIRY